MNVKNLHDIENNVTGKGKKKIRSRDK